MVGRLQRGVRGAKPLLLDHRGMRGDSAGNRLHARPNDHGDGVEHAAATGEQMSDHRPAGQRMQAFRKRRLHPRSESGARITAWADIPSGSGGTPRVSNRSRELLEAQDSALDPRHAQRAGARRASPGTRYVRPVVPVEIMAERGLSLAPRTVMRGAADCLDPRWINHAEGEKCFGSFFQKGPASLAFFSSMAINHGKRHR